MICSKCKEEFRNCEKGCKMIPKPLCPSCVISTAIFQCPSCYSKGCTADEFYRTTCFHCDKEGCVKCIPYQVMCEGMSFDYCEEHKYCKKDRMRETAKELIEEEATQNTGRSLK